MKEIFNEVVSASIFGLVILIWVSVLFWSFFKFLDVF
jgi:hypothetical protein